MSTFYLAKQLFFLSIGLISIDQYFHMLPIDSIEFLFPYKMTTRSNVFTGCLNLENFTEFKLVKKTKLSPNTEKFTFALPAPCSVLGLPVGQHIICRFK
jgi:hypothetical protein